MRSIRAITAAIVAVCTFNGTLSLSEFKVKNIQMDDRQHEPARVQSLRGFVNSVVVGDPSATENQEFET